MEKQIREIIAQHVGGTYEAKQKCAEEILRLFSVVGQSEQLECKCPTNSATIEEEIEKNKCFECGLPIVTL